MRRHGPTLLVLALLVATAAAFVVAERVKLEKSPIRGPRVDAVFSPVCECPDHVATISFRLSRPDRLGVGIVDQNERLVRTLVEPRPFLALHRLEFEWNGRDNQGRIVGEGTFRPRLRFTDRDRTIVLPNPIRVDRSPPRVEVLSVKPRVISPDGDGRAEGVAVRYKTSEPARALLFVDGVRRVRGQVRTKLFGQLQWYGRAGGTTFPAGRYRLRLEAEDEAGNVSIPREAGVVRVRFIEVAPAVIHVRARARFRLQVETDAAAYSWRFAGRRGVAHGRSLVFRAPGPGRYGLLVSEQGRAARVTVLVRRRRKG